MKYSLIVPITLLLSGTTYAEAINFACMIQPAKIVEVRSPITGSYRIFL